MGLYQNFPVRSFYLSLILSSSCATKQSVSIFIDLFLWSEVQNLFVWKNSPNIKLTAYLFETKKNVNKKTNKNTTSS